MRDEYGRAREWIACHHCGQQTVKNDTKSTVVFDGPPQYFCGTCWEQQRQEAAQAAATLRTLDAVALHEGDACVRALVLPLAPGPASAEQVRQAVPHEEAWARAVYTLLRAKRQRSSDWDIGVGEDGVDGHTEDDLPAVARPFLDCEPNEVADWWRGFYHEDDFGSAYIEDLERFLNMLMDDLTRLRQLGQPGYEPDRSTATEVDNVRAWLDGVEQVWNRRALEDWQRQQHQQDQEQHDRE